VRVLLLVHRVPYPPDKGDKIRSWRLVEALTEAHEVDLVAAVDDPRDFAHVDVLHARCSSAQLVPLRPSFASVRAAFALLTGRPATVAWFLERAAKKAVAFAMKRRPPDVVVLFSGQTAAWLPMGDATPLVADLVDVDSEKFEQYAAEKSGLKAAIFRREATTLRAFEAAIARRARFVALTTPREVALFRSKIADGAIEAIGNGVEERPLAPSKERDRDALVFVGAMDYAANVEAAVVGATKILPLLRAKRPGATFRIVGRNPAAAVRALASLPGVEVVGAVPDVAPFVARAGIALVPLRVARGVQNKVLEALSFGTPVVASPDVAASLGLPQDGGGVVRVGATPESAAAAALELMEAPERADALGAAGRAFVRAEFRWDRFADRFRDLVARAGGVDPRAPSRRRLPETAGEPAL
jgi:polysaccharide biosynthesis protein PslH